MELLNHNIFYVLYVHDDDDLHDHDDRRVRDDVHDHDDHYVHIRNHDHDDRRVHDDVRIHLYVYDLLNDHWNYNFHFLFLFIPMREKLLQRKERK